MDAVVTMDADVAPLVGAWIEISESEQWKTRAESLLL